MFIGLLHQLFGVHANQLAGKKDAAVVLVADSLVKRDLETKGSTGAAALVCQAAVLRRALNLATVLNYTTHCRLLWELVEIKGFFGIPQVQPALCAHRSVSAAVRIDEAQFLA